LGYNRKLHKIVICEFKIGGGEADDGPQQVFDYSCMIQASEKNQSNIRDAIKRIVDCDELDFKQDIMLYLIVVGHVSELLKMRARTLFKGKQAFRIFQIKNDPYKEKDLANWKKADPVEVE
jgi:hypothetical protein